MSTDKRVITNNVSPGELFTGRFSGRGAFAQLVRDAFKRTALEGWPEIILADATFEDWPLGESSVMESLQAWAKSGRQMIILASRYDELIRKHPRFVSWRQTWGHLIDCRLERTPLSQDFPCAIWSPSWFMHRQDPLHSIGICSVERARSVQLREVLDERIRNSGAGFPSSVLGL